MEWFSTWWGNLEFIEQILYAIAIPSSLVLIIQIILIFVGAAGGGVDSGGFDSGLDTGFGDGFDSGLDTGFGDGLDTGLDMPDISDVSDISDNSGNSGKSDFSVASMFTVQGVASFFCVFGWASLLIYKSGLPWFLALIVSFLLGFAVMYASALILRKIMKLEHSGTLNVKNLLGSSGTVYLSIPPKGEGSGKVTVQTSERYVEFDAVSNEEISIPNNTQIRVIDITGNNILVVEREDEQ